MAQAVSDRLPQVDLPELLLEIDARTGFVSPRRMAFDHVVQVFAGSHLYAAR
jgi:hypothetical protein